jgi:hypothetical protein
MRSRTMLRRLDRIAPAEAEDESLPNLSVLSPWEYDRLMDLIDRIAAKSLSPTESQELEALWGKCPVRGTKPRRRKGNKPFEAVNSLPLVGRLRRHRSRRSPL